MQPQRNAVTIRIEFSALDALVAYLRERDANQAKIDAMAAQVAEATAGLHTSSAALQGAVEETQTVDGPRP